MARYKDADAWLEWAQTKYEQAQERFAWAQSTDSATMDSYSELVAVIEDGLVRRAEIAGANEGKQIVESSPLAELANHLEFLGSSGFTLSAHDCAEAAQLIRRAIDG